MGKHFIDLFHDLPCLSVDASSFLPEGRYIENMGIFTIVLKEKKVDAISMLLSNINTSYKNIMSISDLEKFLLSGNIQPGLEGQVLHLIDETPTSLIASAIKQLALNKNIEAKLIWQNLAKVADQIKSPNIFWSSIGQVTEIVGNELSGMDGVTKAELVELKYQLAANAVMEVKLKTAAEKYKSDYLKTYASQDALFCGKTMPDVDGLSEPEAIICLSRFMSDCEVFLPEDPNLDNQKRNLSIRLFIDFSINEIRESGKLWLNKFKSQHGHALWFKEWTDILDTFSDDELIKIYLSSDETSTRRRISRPTGLLPFDVSLEVKQKGYAI